MSDKHQEVLKSLKEALEKETPESIAKFFGPPLPKGWIAITDRLPMMYAADIMQGYSEFKVKDENGVERITRISDHNTWYHGYAVPMKITHWYNE